MKEVTAYISNMARDEFAVMFGYVGSGRSRVPLTCNTEMIRKRR